jgi:DNA-directed RNA polymerase subunit RPC12/RpoP
MSEFKYACPVCGQHIKCDSSQAGEQMECPTCFQKITVPQAPAEEQKFIITGTKKSDRPAPKIPEESPRVIPAGEGFSGAVAVILILIFIGTVVAFVYRGTIFKPSNNSTTVAGAAEESNQVPAKAQRPSRVALVAPPANDADWMLNLDSMTNFSDATAAGRIHGQNFICDRAFLQNGTLTLRAGTHGPVDFGVQINFGGAQPEALAGQSLNIGTNAPMAARITLHWLDGGQAVTEDLEGGYAMRLDFGQVSSNRISGKIYFCAPDEMKSYIVGTFNAQIHKPRQ